MNDLIPDADPTLDDLIADVGTVCVLSEGREVTLNLDMVTKLASVGLDLKQIAAFYGMTVPELRKRHHVYARLKRAVAQGEARGLAKVAHALFQNATENNALIGQIFIMKAKGGWREADKVKPEIEDDDKVQVLLPDNFRD